MEHFEAVVLLSLPFIDFIAEHSHLTTIASALVVFLVWFIFHYHFNKANDYEYFVAHTDTAVRFSKPTFDMFQYIAMAFLPCAIFVFIFCVVTKFNTEMFLATFSVKDRFNLVQKFKNRRVIQKASAIKKPIRKGS